MRYRWARFIAASPGIAAAWTDTVTARSDDVTCDPSLVMRRLFLSDIDPAIAASRQEFTTRKPAKSERRPPREGRPKGGAEQ